MLHNVKHHLALYSIASLNEQWGKTPLLRAALSGHADVALFLLESGSDVHEQAIVSMVKQSCVFVHLVSCSCYIRLATFAPMVLEHFAVWTLKCIYIPVMKCVFDMCCTIRIDWHLYVTIVLF